MKNKALGSPRNLIRKSLALLTAACICFVGLGTDAAQAGGPWGRATGEAVELRRKTEDLRNRLERLFRGSPAAAWAVETDELAKQIKSATESHIGADEFNALIDGFNAARSNTDVFVRTDPYIAGDDRIVDYLEDVAERLERFVKDLRKADPPAVAYRSPYVSPAYPAPHYGDYSHRPQAYTSPGYTPHSHSYGAHATGRYGYRIESPFAGGAVTGSREYRSYRQPASRGGIEIHIPPTVVHPPYAVPGPRIAL